MIDDFKFGRPYFDLIDGGTLINKYLTDLYGEPGNPVHITVGIPTPIHRERDVISLYRRDLNRASSALDIGNINCFCFKSESMTMEELETADFVFFVDDDGRTKELKNRNGNAGVIVNTDRRN